VQGQIQERLVLVVAAELDRAQMDLQQAEILMAAAGRLMAVMAGIHIQAQELQDTQEILLVEAVAAEVQMVALLAVAKSV
jgi:hypothetical protein